LLLYICFISVFVNFPFEIGLAHLEALEILPNQCEKKVQTLLVSMPVETLSAIKADLVKIKQVFEWDENEDDDGKYYFDISQICMIF